MRWGSKCTFSITRQSAFRIVAFGENWLGQLNWRIRDLSSVHTRADYGRLFTEKIFFIIQMARSTAYYAA